MTKKLITSALPYVNNVPHLGNIIGSVLSADVYARFCRLRGYETLYICGTDEYGTATETKAIEQKTTPKQICDEYWAIHKQIYDNFNIQFDYFGRTSIPEHAKTTQDLFKSLDDNGYIFQDTTDQLFCPVDDMFLADRYVQGTCPHCGYDDARGDQCDKCSKLLIPVDLINPRCKICQNTPHIKATTHLYLDLPKLAPQIKEFFDHASKQGHWPANAISTTKSWINQSLSSRAITRDIKWGVPVPKKGFENKVFYVWFDAVIGYISFTKKLLPDSWQKWWLNPDKVQLYQFMGKDNIPFHSIIFPAIKLGSKKNWTLLHNIQSTEYLNYQSQKFSKSRNIGVFGTDINDINLDIDWWRLYLMANRPEHADTNFDWHDFALEINANFIDNVGNLVARTTTLAKKLAKQEPIQEEDCQQTAKFIIDFEQLYIEAITELEKSNLRNGLKNIFALGHLSNKFIQQMAPWKLLKTNIGQAKTIISAVLVGIKHIALLLQPYMPQKAALLLNTINCSQTTITSKVDWATIGPIPPEQHTVLFEKIEPQLINDLIIKYGGQTEDQAIINFQQLNIIAAKINSCQQHPTVKRLLILQLQTATDKSINVVSSLAESYSGDELLGKHCLVLVNIKPQTISGVQSQGLLLTAQHKKVIEPITCEAPIGSQVTLDKPQYLPNSAEIVDLENLKNAKIKVYNSLLNINKFKLLIANKEIKTSKILNGNIT